mmetsp:Transcript_10972/g.20095  ORF Transcript_10972/g.20095 Transcript_10972/m.20095 type:complete len:359 (+) Transcript_10972:122-1198(+)
MPKSHHSSRSQAGVSTNRSAETAATSKSSPSKSDASTVLTAKERLDLYKQNTSRSEDEDEEELALKRKLIPRLAQRAYHLEDDNSWWQDWVQYQRNTHPVFGICMHHRFHPIRLPQRIIILVGSIAFGFAVTNCVYLGFLGNETSSETVNNVYEATGKLAVFQQKFTNVELQQSMVFLLTVGSFLHSTFDMSIWYLMACFCFRPGGHCQGEGEGGKCRGRFQNLGIYMAVLVVMIAVVAATFVAIVRLNEDQERAAERSATLAEQFAGEQLDGENSETAESSSRFTFLVGYALELVFALFVFYFITSTVFFSGILGCGRIPVLGGRPYEMRKARLGNNDDEYDENEEGDFRGMQAYDV